MSTALVTYVEAATTPAQLVSLVVRTKARVATTSGAFCTDQSSEVWFPVAPNTTLPSPPASTTNASPKPPNAVLLPLGTDLSDICFIFQDLLPLSSAPVYAVELEPTVVLPPYIEEIPLLGITVVGLSIREYPYELTLPTASITAVTRSVIQIPTYLLSLGSGSFTTTGQAASLNQGRRVIGAAGAFALTGAASGSLRGYVVAGAAGPYALAGQAAALVYQRNPFAAEAGAFVFQGQDAQWFRGKKLFADAGSFAVSGEPAGLLSARVLPASSETFSVNGQNAALLFDDFFASWTEQTYVDSWLDAIDWWAD